MDERTLTELLSGKHFDMEERIERAAWPHPPLRYSDLVDHVASVLRREKHFPRPWAPHVNGAPVEEHIVLERRAPWQYVARVRRHHPTNPYSLAEETARRFWTARGAADFYLRWELHLPGSLDGWQVIR